MNERKLINRKTLHEIIPLSERAIFDMEKEGKFPRRIVANLGAFNKKLGRA